MPKTKISSRTFSELLIGVIVFAVCYAVVALEFWREFSRRFVGTL